VAELKLVESRLQRRRRETRARLLEAAEQVFVEKGYDSATLNQITEGADLGIGTFYNYFSGKRGIYNALIRRHYLLMHERWLRRCRQGMPVEKQLAASVRVSLECFEERPRLWRLFLVEGPPMGEDDFLRLQADVAGEFREALSRVATSSSAIDVDLDILTVIILHVSIGLGRWLLSAKPPADTGKVADQAVAFLVRGRLKPKAVKRRL